MKNVTITLKEELASWAKVMAARNGKSLSAFIVQLLQQSRSSIGNSENEALSAFRSFKPKKISVGGERAFKREEIYDRSRIS